MSASRASHKALFESKLAKFKDKIQQTEEELKSNVWSDTYVKPEFSKTAKDYARPLPGSLTEKRAAKAGNYITSEMIFCCELIANYGKGEPPNCIVKFGPLFSAYQHYSGHLIGMLKLARKYELIDFEGEMLYQKQDDNKDIRLLKSIEEIKRIVRFSGDPVNCVQIVQ